MSPGAQGRRSETALFLASTYNHLLMCQALARRLAGRYSDARIVWFGDRPLSELAEVRVAPSYHAAWADVSGLGRLKLWQAGARVAHREAVRRLRQALDPWPQTPADLFVGNESHLFVQVAMREVGATWADVVLYEEGVGFYAGSERFGERLLVNALLRLRGFPYREFHRNFSRNRRITRLACNHPALVERPDAEILDTRTAYRNVVEEAARRVRSQRGGEGAPVECLYVSGNLSGARNMTLAEELSMLGDIHRALTERCATPVHVKFHPRDPAEKREAMRRIGFRELSWDGPFEVEYLARPYRLVLSVRSSVMLNASVLSPSWPARLWLIRGDRPPLDRIYARPEVARVFDRMVAEHEGAEYFDPYARA